MEKLSDHLKAMMSGIDGAVKGLQKITAESLKNMTPEQAQELAKVIQEQDLEGKMKQAQDQMNALNNLFNR